jgi:hypothetical protein
VRGKYPASWVAPIIIWAGLNEEISEEDRDLLLRKVGSAETLDRSISNLLAKFRSRRILPRVSKEQFSGPLGRFLLARRRNRIFQCMEEERRFKGWVQQLVDEAEALLDPAAAEILRERFKEILAMEP